MSVGDRDSGVLWSAGEFASRVTQRSTRQCTRTACSALAEVTLTYEYGNSQVWLDPLSGEREPNGYDLCSEHADALKVPLGWQLGDRRPRSGDEATQRQLLAG